MATVVFINRLQSADGKRDALIGLLREFADSINANPECLHYSVHEPIDDEATRRKPSKRKPQGSGKAEKPAAEAS
jgi:quinol monooxygenase YgiN